MSTQIKIEKGIKIPECRGRLQPVLRSLKVGDSFLYPLKLQGSIGTAARNAKIKAATRKVSPTEVRVWRVA